MKNNKDTHSASGILRGVSCAPARSPELGDRGWRGARRGHDAPVLVLAALGLGLGRHAAQQPADALEVHRPVRVACRDVLVHRLRGRDGGAAVRGPQRLQQRLLRRHDARGRGRGRRGAPEAEEAHAQGALKAERPGCRLTLATKRACRDLVCFCVLDAFRKRARLLFLQEERPSPTHVFVLNI